MKKKWWILILSAILSITINFTINIRYFWTFALSSIITTFVIWGTLTLIGKSIKSIKENKPWKFLLYAIIILIIIILAVGTYIISNGLQSNLQAITPSHFRTNIITRQCNFGGGSSVVSIDPWYYKPGCNLQQEELYEIMKTSGNEDHMMIDMCNHACSSGLKDGFCSEKDISLWGNHKSNRLRCDYLVDCENITCS